MMKRVFVIFVGLGCLAAACATAGCRREQPDGRPADWFDDAKALEQERQYFQENRENAPLGALEYYRFCLADGSFDQAALRDIRHEIDWLSAIKLMMTEDDLGKPRYRQAIEALTAFRAAWPDSPHRGQALFFRGLAKEYDVDYQDVAGATADYREFIQENPTSPLLPEAWVRIAHAWEFNLSRPDYGQAVAAYDKVIEKFGPTNEAVRSAPTLTRMCVERSLYAKARIMEDHLAETNDAERARACYAEAARCYERLTDPVFFGKTRFRQSQFVHFRLGCLLAEKLDRPEEGLRVLQSMAERWRESPWFGKVTAKMGQIKKKAGRDKEPAPSARPTLAAATEAPAAR